MRKVSIIILLFVVLSELISASIRDISLGFVFESEIENELIIIADNNNQFIDVGIVNIETMELEFTPLDSITSIPHIALINNVSNRIAFIDYKHENLYVYNYKSGAFISKYLLPFSPYNFAFSKDGNSFYSSKNGNSEIIVFDVLNGKQIDSIKLREKLDDVPSIFYNSEKDEIALQIGSVLEYWSVPKKKLIRTTPVLADSHFAVFKKEGEIIIYEDEGMFYIDSTLNGNNIFQKRISEYSLNDFYCSWCKIELSPNMRYLMINISETEQFIYDLVSDSAIVFDESYSTKSYKSKPYVHYVNSDFTKALVNFNTSPYCGRYAELPSTGFDFYFYNINNKKNISSIPAGYIDGGGNYVFGDNNNNIIVYSDEFKVLINKDEEFERYIDISGKPVILFNSSKSLVVQDSSLLKIYNLESNQIEREFDTGNNSYDKFHFSNTGNGKIIAINFSKIVVYDLQDFSIVSEFDFSLYALVADSINYDGISLFTSYKDSKIYKYDILSNELIISNEIITPDDFHFRDLSRDGRYILYQNIDNKIISIYDVKRNQYTEASLKGTRIKESTTFHGIGFLGHNELVWYEYETDFITREKSSRIYDFASDSETWLYGEGKPYVSDYGDLYIGNSCPNSYNVGTIRDPILSVETTNEINGSVFPNPANDFIQLDYDMSSGFSDIQIYNSFGKQVMAIDNANINDKIDISSLTAGVYFVKVGEMAKKFIKH